MRIATYNTEWFNALFDDTGRMLDDDGPSARYGITRGQQLAALGRVFQALDADAVMVVEAPDEMRGRPTAMALESFALRFGLRARRAVMGFANDSQQEIALLHDPDVLECRHAPQEGPPPRFDQSYRIDLNIDGRPDLVTYSKPPLEIAGRLPDGREIRLIGVHIKSKAPHGARNEAHLMRLAVQNRRKQLAQAIWLRERVVRHLEAGDSLIVMGDFNDGPGLDEYEELFGRSAVEIVLGWNEPKALRLYDAHARRALGQRNGAQPASSRFYNVEEGRYFQALIDFVMVSPDIRALCPRWRIWHPFDDPECYQNPGLREALLTASDHFPVSVDVNF